MGSLRPARIVACLAPLALVVAGCGGGTRQDAGEPSGTYRVEVLDASFPTRQSLAEPAVMRVQVHNSGTKAIPDVAVTVDSFDSTSQQQGLASDERPVWIVDQGPVGGTTAYVNTWALGRLPAGATRTFTWHVTAVAAGRHTVSYRVAAGLNGKARARLAGGGVPGGSITVAISGKPAQAVVDPATGDVVRKP
jgi:hypothetical protein